MKKTLILIVIGLSVLMFTTSLWAKCMTGSDWKDKSGKRIVVCVKGDSFDDRKAGRSVCDKVKGGKCGDPTTFSSSCANNECYDAGGKNYNSLSGF